MHARHPLLAALTLACAATACQGTPGRRAPAEPPPAPEPTAAAPARETVLVELFTSQGCSSCPPADRLLSDLDSLELSVDVVPLAFHVDTWNYIGWADPFSSPRWSERQHAYARRIAGGRSYTPQLVVDGRAHAVGSQRSDVAATIEAAAARPSASIDLEAAVDRPSDGALRIAAGARGARPAGSALDVWVAFYESGVTTNVERGENAGRTLANDYIVRALERAARLDPGAEHASGEVVIALDPAWQRDRLGVAVFAQDPSTLEVVAARRAR